MVFKNIRKYSLVAVIVCILVLTLLYVDEVSTPLPSRLPAQLPLPQNLTTQTWGIFDVETGEIVAGNNIDVALPIASVTKLFTAEAVIRSEKRDTPFTIRASDLNAEGRAGKLAIGQEVTPYELLYPLLIESSNDAAEAIVRSLGDEFVNSVQTTGESLSLSRTAIFEPTGLSPKNTSSVSDLSRFYVHMRRENPHLLDITQLHTYISPSTGYLNNNPARKLVSFTGGKHGFTDEAQKTFVGTFDSPLIQTELGIVVLESSDLVADIEALLHYGESMYDY